MSALDETIDLHPAVAECILRLRSERNAAVTEAEVLRSAVREFVAAKAHHDSTVAARHDADVSALEETEAARYASQARLDAPRVPHGDRGRREVSALDVATIVARALAATENVRDDGYRITAPDGTVIVEYKYSYHRNAQADSALFAHAREDVLALADALRERELQLNALRTAAREYLAACVSVETTIETFKRHVAAGDPDAARASMRDGAAAIQRADALHATLTALAAEVPRG